MITRRRAGALIAGALTFGILATLAAPRRHVAASPVPSR